MQLTFLHILDESLHEELNNEFEGFSLDKDDFHFYVFLLTFNISSGEFYKYHSVIYPFYSIFKDSFNA